MNQTDYIRLTQETSDYIEGLSFNELSQLVTSFKEVHPELKATRSALLAFLVSNTIEVSG